MVANTHPPDEDEEERDGLLLLAVGGLAVGALAGLTGAVVRAPVTGIALIVEMTGATTLFVPLLTACASAVAAPELLGSRPIYDTLQDRDAHRGPAK